MPALALALALLVASPALADTIVLDFAEEAQGDRGNSFLSAECGCVVLSEASGFETLVIITTSLEGAPAIVPGSQGGSLRLDFVDALVTGVAITFGGDYPPDPEYSVYPATLNGYADDALVATAALDANQNFMMDQTVSLVWSEPLTHATFSFVQFGPHQPESPFIGGITLTVESVPEPGVAALLLAAAGLGLARVRSRSRRRPGMFGAALTLAVAFLFAAAPGSAATIVLDFEEEAVGTRTGPFVSAEHPGVTLSEISGAFGQLIVIDFYLGTRALLVGEEGGTLILDFAMPVTAVSMDFGGDWIEDSSPARLRGYASGVLVALAELEANHNGAIDQTITLVPGVAIDRVTFGMSQLGPDDKLSALVDNIALTVPEPSVSLVLVALAVGAAVRAARFLV